MRTFFVNTCGVRTFVQSAGKGDPLLFIHGAQLNSDLWSHQLEFFSGDFQCIAYDLRGHGRTGASSLAHYSTELYAEDLLALIDSFGFEKVTLCGLSLGGMIAQSFAAKYPDRLNGMVLCDTGFSSSYFLSDRALNTAVGAITGPCIQMFGVTRFRKLSRGISNWIGPRTWVTRTVRGTRFARRAAEMIDPKELVKIFETVLRFDGTKLARPDLPVLLINGLNDSPLILRQARILQHLYPGAEYKSIPRAGHLSNLDDPGQFNSILNDFLKGIRTSAIAPNLIVRTFNKGRQWLAPVIQRRPRLRTSN